MKKKLLTIVMVTAMFLALALPVLASQQIPAPVPPTDPGMQSIAGKVIGIVQFLGIVVAVVMIIVYGIKYFTADVSGQADLKKAAPGFLIGAVCIFGAVAILEFVKKTIETQTII